MNVESPMTKLTALILGTSRLRVFKQKRSAPNTHRQYNWKSEGCFDFEQ